MENPAVERFGVVTRFLFRIVKDKKPLNLIQGLFLFSQ